MTTLLKSVFWLSVAYLAIVPHGDLRGEADKLANAAVSAGQRLVVQQMVTSACGESCTFTAGPMTGIRDVVALPRPRPARPI